MLKTLTWIVQGPFLRNLYLVSDKHLHLLGFRHNLVWTDNWLFLFRVYAYINFFYKYCSHWNLWLKYFKIAIFLLWLDYLFLFFGLFCFFIILCCLDIIADDRLQSHFDISVQINVMLVILPFNIYIIFFMN